MKAQRSIHRIEPVKKGCPMNKTSYVMQVVFAGCLLAAIRFGIEKAFHTMRPEPNPKYSIYENLERLNNKSNIPDYSFLRNPSSLHGLKAAPLTLAEQLKEQREMQTRNQAAQTKTLP